MQALIHRAYAQCEEILKANMDKLEEISAFLLEHETMSAREFAEHMGIELPETEQALPDETQPAPQPEHQDAEQSEDHPDSEP